MSPEWGLVVVGAATGIGTIVTIVFVAGAIKGSIEARLDYIESRLTTIERAMTGAGFIFTGKRSIHDPS